MLASAVTPSIDRVLDALEADLGGADAPLNAYHDRVRSPEATVAALKSHFPRLGITRLGLLTGLDTIGIPVAFATRPASRNLSVFQGKGVDVESALASAAMEALETRLAENRPDDLVIAPLDAMRSSGKPMLDLARTARCIPDRVAEAGDLHWVEGVDLVSGQRVMTPWALVGIDHRLPRMVGFEQSSDGLASGNTATEATLHALCELVERDAWALMQLWPETRLRAALVDPRSLMDPVLNIMVDRVERSGISLLLIDMTSDIGVPCYMSILVPHPDARPGDVRWGEICAGCGCHPSAGRAALRAVTEAAQSRLTVIAGGRDDLEPRIYAKPADKGNRARQILDLVKAPKHPIMARDFASGQSLQDVLAGLADRLVAKGIGQIVVVPLDPMGTDVSVVRVIVPGLEIGLEGEYLQLGLRFARTYAEYVQ